MAKLSGWLRHCRWAHFPNRLLPTAQAIEDSSVIRGTFQCKKPRKSFHFILMSNKKQLFSLNCFRQRSDVQINRFLSRHRRSSWIVKTADVCYFLINISAIFEDRRQRGASLIRVSGNHATYAMLMQRKHVVLIFSVPKSRAHLTLTKFGSSYS